MHACWQAAQQRAQEAEEDQQRAEEQTAAAILELHALQARLSATGAEGSDASDAANGLCIRLPRHCYQWTPVVFQHENDAFTCRVRFLMG